MSQRNLSAETRNDFGKNATNRLRASGYIPAVLYSHGNTESIKILSKEFSTLFKGHISESILINLNIKDKKEDSEHTVFVKDYKLDPVSEQVLHLDLYKITADEKIRTMVPLITKGTPVGVKAGGVLEIFERELEIECLPKDLPEQIVVDITGIEIGHSLHVNDLNLGEQIRFIDTTNKPVAAVIIPHVKDEESADAEAAEGAAAADASKADETKK